ncbi:MAG: electron transport complex subunit E [Gammaproteobacteria bacterium]
MAQQRSLSEITMDGLWRNNPGLVQLLGLCPLLAVTSTAINGLALGLATTLTLIGSNVVVSAIRNHVKPEIRIPVFVLVIASIVTTIELLMASNFYELYLVLGIFIPLIVTNCSIIGRAEAFASKNPLLPAFVDGLTMGLGFTAVLVVLGGMREMLGNGTLFAGAANLLGPSFAWLEITLIADYRGFLLAVLPPGAFIGLGLLVAIKNVIDKRLEQRSKELVGVVAETP